MIHLHVQVKDRAGNPISPDLALRAGQQKLESKAKPEPPDPGLLDFDPDAYSPVKPKVTGRSVSAKVAPEAKWVVEVIGEGGRVDLVLGEFFTYKSALYCSQKWGEAHPGDLRLTREREVALKGGR